MTTKPYKSQKRGAGRHVQLAEYLQASAAWSSLKPGPRALYIELKRRYNGTNNGDIFLSHRLAAKALNINRNTVTGYFAALEERGFIRMTQAPHLGPVGVGVSAKWALTEEPALRGKPAEKGFMVWAEKAKAPPKKQAGAS